MNNCKPIQISEKLFKCKVCGFEHTKNFIRNCQPIEVKPHVCIHTGDLIETLDTTQCNCAGRGIGSVEIRQCEKFGGKCGLLSLLKYDKKAALQAEGVRNCGQCEFRFDTH